MFRPCISTAAVFLIGAAPASLNSPPQPGPTTGLPVKPSCPKPENRVVNGREDKGLLRKLDELPPGRLVLAVEQSVGGCPVLVLPAPDETGRVWVPAGEATTLQAKPARTEPANADPLPPS